MKLYRWCAALLVAALAVLSPAAQTDDYGRFVNGISEPWTFRSKNYTDEFAAAAMTRWREIGDENRQAPDEWAGDYLLADDYSEVNATYLRWSPRAGYVLAWIYTCEPRVTSVDYGRVAASPASIEFFPTAIKHTLRGWSVNGHTHRQTLEISRFVPVKWGGQHLLVPENQFAAFADYVAGLGRFNSGHPERTHIWVDYFHKRDEDPREGTRGMPSVPPGYERRLKRPVEAEVTAVGKPFFERDRASQWYDQLYVPVRINAGREHGLRAGMSLHIVGPGPDETVTLARVGRLASRGFVACPVKKGARTGPCLGVTDEPEPSAIALGAKLSTSPHR